MQEKNYKERKRSLSDKIYSKEQIFSNLEYNLEKKKENKEWIYYLDIVVSFDIETSSFINNGEKHGNMYIWMLCCEGKTCIGRTWDEFTDTIEYMVDTLGLNYYRRVVVWIHNLAFEFQWFCKKFNWSNIFAREKRKPMKATTFDGVEFRCSYMLSGCSLEKVGKDLQKYKVNKLVGNLDYKLVRGPKTYLSDNELKYCINDVLVVCGYIWEQMEYYGKLTKLPLTNTGRVRKLCKDRCYDKKHYGKYRELMNRLTLQEDEYKLVKRAFQGGFTHANYLYSEDTLESVQSYDFTSSYPTVMVAEKYPCTKGEKVDVTIEEIEENQYVYCYIFNVRFKNIRTKVDYENYISKSKCWELSKPIENNGRIMKADLLTTTITEIDYFIIKEYYEWDEIEVGECWRYRKAYLPTPLVETIVELYEDKTTLKDVPGQELDYLLKKGMLNSCYGMSCMEVAMDEVTFDEIWESKEPILSECIEKYNNDKSRFLFYPWAVYITAYARRNLFYGISECKDDYIYADTDSIKILNKDNHKDFIERYNKWITQKLEMACNYHHIDVERIRPKTIKDEPKPLGVWDDDGFYDKFKTLGAKRYLIESKGKLKATVAGVSKFKLAEYLTQQDDAFEFFQDGMVVPEEYSGKLTCAYFDNKIKGKMADYQGNIYEYEEDSGIYMGTSEYNLGISELYRILLNSKTEVMY